MPHDLDPALASQAGGKAVGLTGKDGQLLKARQVRACACVCRAQAVHRV